MFARIDHIGVAVEDLDAAIALLRRTFGMALVHRETVEEQGVEAVLLDVGENHVELLRAARPGHAGRASSSPGAARACTTSPTRSTTSTPRSDALRGGPAAASTRRRAPASAARASRSCTPSATGGVLTEIVQPAEGTDPWRQRISIGFQGSQVLTLKMEDADLDALLTALLGR